MSDEFCSTISWRHASKMTFKSEKESWSLHVLCFCIHWTGQSHGDCNTTRRKSPWPLGACLYSVLLLKWWPLPRPALPPHQLAAFAFLPSPRDAPRCVRLSVAVVICLSSGKWQSEVQKEVSLQGILNGPRSTSAFLDNLRSRAVWPSGYRVTVFI